MTSRRLDPSARRARGSRRDRRRRPSPTCGRRPRSPAPASPRTHRRIGSGPDSPGHTRGRSPVKRSPRHAFQGTFSACAAQPARLGNAEAASNPPASWVSKLAVTGTGVLSDPISEDSAGDSTGLQEEHESHRLLGSSMTRPTQVKGVDLSRRDEPPSWWSCLVLGRVPDGGSTHLFGRGGARVSVRSVGDSINQSARRRGP
jgi:hypothetical protein